MSRFVAGEQDAEARFSRELFVKYSAGGGKAETISEGARCDDLDRLHLLQGQQISFIAGHQVVGHTGDGGGQNGVVVGIWRKLHLREFLQYICLTP